jgi:hypothetical protein
MFNILVLQAQDNLSHARMEFMIKVRLGLDEVHGFLQASERPMRTQSCTSATGVLTDRVVCLQQHRPTLDQNN